MKLVNFESKGVIYPGAVIDDRVVVNLRIFAKKTGAQNLARVESVDEILSKGLLDGVGDLLSSRPGDLDDGESLVPLEKVRLKSPLLSPEKILLVALNFAAHGKEVSAEIPKEPYFFTKFRSCIIGPGEAIIVPRSSRKVDWEGELAVVIGREGKYIPKKEAMDYVGGYSIANDVSFRDYQYPRGWPKVSSPLGYNWVMGKGLDASFPLGPWIVTKDELRDPYDRELSLSVNGVVKQKARIGDMVFKISDLIEYVSSGITLKPGDIISTGTPPGVSGYAGTVFLKKGDIVETSIQGIGTLKNTVIEEE